jgi:D-glycero-D-manno-heptose 1,7-bisphosphate phosphatase
MANIAVFFDRDGTLIRDPGYLTHPDQVELLDGTAEALKELRFLGYKTVVVSNQPGVARGVITEEMLGQIHERLGDLVSQKGGALDAIYYCPYHPDGSVPKYRQDSDWRKPRPGMLLAAAAQMDIDLAESWMVGDSSRDIEAGRSAGCRTILISSAHESPEGTDRNKPDHVAVNLGEAVNIIKTYHRSGQDEHVLPVFIDRSPSLSVGNSQKNEMPEKSSPETPSPIGGTPEAETTTPELLADILEQLKRMQKAKTFDEFSLLRLLAGVVQVFVPFCLLVAFWLLISMDPGSNHVLVALGFAGVLQLMVLTFYIVNGRR